MPYLQMAFKTIYLQENQTYVYIVLNYEHSFKTTQNATLTQNVNNSHL